MNLTKKLCMLAIPLALPFSNAFALSDGDTVRIVVPYSAGGGYDAQARLLTPYLKEELIASGLDDVNVIVTNMTGGGGAIATSNVYQAEGDGTTLLLLDPETSLWQQTLSNPIFDLREFKYIAQQSADPLAFTIRKDLGVEDFDELVKRSSETPVLMGTSGIGNHDHALPLVMEKMLNDHGVPLELEFLHLNGAGDILASMRRGEAESTLEVFSTFEKYVEDGNGEFLFVFGEDLSETLSSPTAKDTLGLPDEELRMLSASANFRRVYVAPPTTDDNTLSTLREAFSRALSNPELVEKAVMSNRPIQYLDAAQIQQAIEEEARLAERYGDYVKSQL
tara:strand:- start:262 stop:1269 length:1008 start_codon:yes stop_codon:yes gene_type:complete